MHKIENQSNKNSNFIKSFGLNATIKKILARWHNKKLKMEHHDISDY